MLIHTAIKTVIYPSPRCDRAPGSHEWLWRHLHAARSPGSCRHPREVRSGALESYDHCGHLVYLCWPNSVGNANGGQVSVSVGLSFC